MSNSALVSVITPCFNAERWLNATIASVLEQTYPNIEIIVVDDGSTDQGPALLSQFGGRINVIRQSNRGGNAARNTGFLASRGEYIQFLDADDLLGPDKIASQVARLTAENVDVVYSDWRFLFHIGETTSSSKLMSGKIGPDPLASLVFHFWCPPFCYLFKRSAVERSLWDENVKIIQDVNFILRMAMCGANFLHAPGFAGYYRRHGPGTVSTQSERKFHDGCLANARMLERFCRANNCLTPARRDTLLLEYGRLLRYYFEHDRDMFHTLLSDVRQLDESYLPRGPFMLRLCSWAIGYSAAEQLALSYRHLKRSSRKPIFPVFLAP